MQWMLLTTLELESVASSIKTEVSQSVQEKTRLKTAVSRFEDKFIYIYLFGIIALQKSKNTTDLREPSERLSEHKFTFFWT